MTEIKLDKSTLPGLECPVKWQTQKDFDNDVWKEGIYNIKEGIFMVGFSDTVSDWDSDWDVLHWEYIDKPVSKFMRQVSCYITRSQN